MTDFFFFRERKEKKRERENLDRNKEKTKRVLTEIKKTDRKKGGKPSEK